MKENFLQICGGFPTFRWIGDLFVICRQHVFLLTRCCIIWKISLSLKHVHCWCSRFILKQCCRILWYECSHKILPSFPKIIHTHYITLKQFLHGTSVQPYFTQILHKNNRASRTLWFLEWRLLFFGLHKWSPIWNC